MQGYLEGSARVVEDDDREPDLHIYAGRDDFALVRAGPRALTTVANPVEPEAAPRASAPVFAVAAAAGAWGWSQGRGDFQRWVYGVGLFGAALYAGVQVQRRGWV